MKKIKKAQKKLINELKNQLFIQAERLGIREGYTPVALEEMKIEALQKILTEFRMEESNLRYELSMFSSNKKELLIKLERLNVYLRKAESLREKSLKSMGKMFDAKLGDRPRVRKVVDRLQAVSVSSSA